MQADKLALLQEFLELEDTANPQGLIHPLPQVGVKEDHVQTEGFGSQCRCSSDPAATNQAERLASEPGRTERRLIVPRARSDRHAAWDQRGEQCQEKHDRMIGDLFGTVVRDVADNHSMARRSLDVDVVVSDAGSHDAPTPWGLRETGFSDPRDIM